MYRIGELLAKFAGQLEKTKIVVQNLTLIYSYINEKLLGGARRKLRSNHIAS